MKDFLTIWRQLEGSLIEPAIFNNFICNVEVADAKLTNQVKRQWIVEWLLAGDNKNNPSDSWIVFWVATVMHWTRSNAATEAQSFSLQDKRFGTFETAVASFEADILLFLYFVSGSDVGHQTWIALKCSKVKLKQNCFTCFYLSWNKICPTTLILFCKCTGTCEFRIFWCIRQIYSLYFLTSWFHVRVTAGEKLLVETSVISIKPFHHWSSPLDNKNHLPFARVKWYSWSYMGRVLTKQTPKMTQIHCWKLCNDVEISLSFADSSRLSHPRATKTIILEILFIETSSIYTQWQVCQLAVLRLQTRSLRIWLYVLTGYEYSILQSNLQFQNYLSRKTSREMVIRL